MDFKGFSKEDISKIKKFHEEESLILNEARNESAKQQSSIRKTNSKLSYKNRSNITRDLHTTNESSAVQHSKSSEVRFPVINQLEEKDLEHVRKFSVEAPSVEKLVNGASPSTPSISEDSFPKTVAILVGEDKSYEVIESTSDAEELQGGHNKVYLLESSVTSDQNGQVKTSLELFQERQKQMEEQNKRRKEILTKAIADRKRQTQHEAKKLLQIQDELNKLDALLSTDVAILRNQIEIASVEFNEAQKRYDRAENEYVEAKVHLFGKLERKELLTEHLCRIIEVNEQRKAKKLSDLMAKLELSEDKTFPKQEYSTDLMIAPPGGSLDEVSYAACNTLKNPNKMLTQSKSEPSVTSFSQLSELSPQTTLHSGEPNPFNNNNIKVDNTQDNVPHLIKNNLYLASESQQFLTAQSIMKK